MSIAKKILFKFFILTIFSITNAQSEELKKVTEEMLERVNNSNNLKEDTNIQKKFKKISENSIYKKTGFSLQGFASISKHFAERYSDLI